MPDQNLVANVPVTVPPKPRDDAAVLAWAAKWRHKFSKQWSDSAKTWAVKWCLTHQDLLETKTINRWQDDLRTALNIELHRDCTRPGSLLGPSGRWVRHHIALRECQSRETGTVPNDTEFTQAMDEWVEVVPILHHRFKSQPQLATLTDVDRAFADLIVEGMMVRQKDRPLWTGAFAYGDDGDDASEAQDESDQDDIGSFMPQLNGIREEPASSDALTPSFQHSNYIRQSVKSSKRSSSMPSMRERKRQQVVDIRRPDHAGLDLNLTEVLGKLGTDLSSAINRMADEPTRIEQRMDKLDGILKSLQQTLENNNKVMDMLQQLLDRDGKSTV